MKSITRIISYGIARLFGIRIVKAQRNNVRNAFPNGSRQLYQAAHINFSIPEDASVLDIGCGPAPFHRATMVCDRFTRKTVHRYGELSTGGLPFVEADIHSLPFADKSFDFVYCAHVLEHIDDPILACREIMRIGKRGYLETPNFMKDTLFCQAQGMHHRWHTIALGNTLFFFEYTPRQQEGIRSQAWSNLIWSPWYHPLQDAFVDNQDVFNTMFLWSDSFCVFVFNKNGTMRHFNGIERV
jgi:SAM-dependent methyltransferase